MSRTTTRPRPAAPVRALARAASVLSTGLAVALLAACTGGAGATSPSDGGSPRAGGDLTVLISNFDAGWVPSKSSISSYEGNVWGEITDKLVYVDPKGAVSPWIAESWDQSKDARTYTLHLKQGVTFSDGTPLDAQAVVTNIDTWAKGDPARGITRIALFPSASYDHAKAVDDHTVEVVFTKPTLGFIPTLGYHGSILVSPKSIALSLDEQGDLSKEIGSGPFVVTSWKAGDSVVLAKRPDYDWGPKVLDHDGPAYLDTVTYKIVKEDSLRSSAVQSGQADVAFNVSPQEIETLRGQGFDVETPRYLGFVHGFKVSTKAAPFDDLRVRQALQHGIDRQQIIDTVYTSDWQAATGFIQGTVPEAGDFSSTFAYDPEQSKKLLDEAGWVAGADGVRVKDGKALELTLYPTPYIITSEPIDELVSQQLTKLGFKVTIQRLDVPSYLDRLTGNQSIALADVTRSFVDVGTVAGVLTDSNGGEDWFAVGHSDATLDRLSADISDASDAASRKKLVDELQEYVLDQGYFVPVTQIVQRIYLQSPKVHGASFNGLAYANYATAWVD
ncbi:ABC transporter substrate-binding protein [Luteimicrobium subarcticum]|uniref:Peptide/nickel transport system substrate-binding protein n=1 Tax=Luteimicrobium subarcticum TaxID=620910 RepID=A0A2M8WRY4_9MICO|nr:ABC transporter substrate-binding protein [Luteimicrobium subarcticum]PJI93678.1 peptide/nickel transport system substrate-binding protein [Luteimicrobium subarcticum]